MNKIRTCNNCTLCKNQKPLLQEFSGTAQAFFVGLSAVKANDVLLDEPFSASTRSGKLLRTIATESGQESSIYFTNLVKCLPLLGSKIRYPNTLEKEACIENLEIELKALAPKKVVLFGRHVSDFILNKYSLKPTIFEDSSPNIEFHIARNKKTSFLIAPHPSFVLIYRRKYLDEYKSHMASYLAN